MSDQNILFCQPAALKEVQYQSTCTVHQLERLAAPFMWTSAQAERRDPLESWYRILARWHHFVAWLIRLSKLRKLWHFMGIYLREIRQRGEPLEGQRVAMHRKLWHTLGLHLQEIRRRGEPLATRRGARQRHQRSSGSHYWYREAPPMQRSQRSSDSQEVPQAPEPSSSQTPQAPSGSSSSTTRWSATCCRRR